ncbi:hypothetical protein HanLR1_Chr16g0619071 [Helianthus annuus]|nr:hypothetical protein HanLR1_Chr16g0619071 [Helianthus annuus]
MQFFMVLMVVKLFANLDHSSGQKRQLSRSTEVLVECSFTRSVRWIVEKKQHLGLQHGEMQKDVQVDLTLWDDYAKDMCSYMVSKYREAHVVIAVHLVLLRPTKVNGGFLIILMVHGFSLTTILIRC